MTMLLTRSWVASSSLLRLDHLGDDFARRQIPLQPAQRGSAERTAHPAPHLGRDADAVAVTVLHDDRFDRIAVGQLEQEFDRTVLGPVMGHFRQSDKIELFGKFVPHRFGQVAHFGEA
ncbi:hypothetical protein LJK87_16380 [Paenibacillus sp. P25]|nr:hypothetical protein LJK87_16380 [Paenibacillus sp. P25]